MELECDTCKYQDLDWEKEEPCTNCTCVDDGNWDKWEPKETEPKMDKDDYIRKQAESGFKVGDMVRVVREAIEGEGGWDNAWVKRMEVGIEANITEILESSGIHLSSGYDYPYFVLEQVTNEPITNTNQKGSMSMKTQEIFAAVVTENVKIKDENGNIESVKKRVIYSAFDIPAFDENNAKAKALIAANKITGVKAIKDLDEVEVKVRPFQGN